MEDGLVPGEIVETNTNELSLNPCCNGRWSRTYKTPWGETLKLS